MLGLLPLGDPPPGLAFLEAVSVVRVVDPELVARLAREAQALQERWAKADAQQGRGPR